MYAAKAWMRGGLKTKNADKGYIAYIGIMGLFLVIQTG